MTASYLESAGDADFVDAGYGACANAEFGLSALSVIGEDGPEFIAISVVGMRFSKLDAIWVTSC